MEKRPLRGAVRGVFFLALTALSFLLYVPALPLGKRARDAVRRFWCRGTARILDIRIRFVGRPFTDTPTVFVANHVSYLDVVALAACCDGTFIAKTEIAGWALFGTMARITGTMFVRRHWRSALIQRNALAARLRQGESFILFAEGTSSDGLTVRPLKTSLLSVAEPWILDCPIAVQPITLVYAKLRDGTPIGRDNCDVYAWHSDAEFVPHLWGALQSAGLDIDVVAGEPVLSWSVRSRKSLGRELRGHLSDELARGRLAAGAEPVADLLDRHAAGLP